MKRGRKITYTTENMKGKRFGRLTIEKVSIDTSKHYRCPMAKCICDCGNKFLVQFYSLIYKNSVSCGCYRKEKVRERSISHDLSRSYTYNSWLNIKVKLINPNHKMYHSLQERGISLFKSWHKFENFLKDMGECPEGYMLKRIDKNKGYDPKNCKWVPKYGRWAP